MKNRFYLSAAVIVTLLSFVSIEGCLFYVYISGVAPPAPATRVEADAIVVLTGGKGRIGEGVRLLEGGAGQSLVLSGVDADADIDSIFINGIERSIRARITLEKRSGSTFENAMEVRRIAAEKGYRSIILVTSSYHMKRALLIFRHTLAGDITIRARRVSSPNFDEKRWWAGKNLALIIPEFLKYQWYAARFGLEGLLA